MFTGKLLRITGVLTLFFFTFFAFSADFTLAKEKEEDELLKARRLYQEGDYESAIKILGDFVAKLKAMVEQKKNVAEAFYLLAKIYYEVGDDTKVEENLAKVFETYPAFTKEEDNFGFKERVEKKRKEYLAQKEKEAKEAEAALVEEEPAEPAGRVIEQPTAPKKKKKKFPVLLVVGGVAAAAVLIFVLSKKKKEQYDIRGNWTINGTFLAEPFRFYMTFSGSKTSGTFADTEGDSGTYTVADKTVSFKYNEYDVTFNGQFTDKDHMSGSLVASGITGTWNGSRGWPSVTKQTDKSAFSRFK